MTPGPSSRFRDTLRMAADQVAGAFAATESPTEDTEEFEDATDEHIPFSMDLAASLDDCEGALKLFFSNDLNGAMSIMRRWEKTSLYHSLGAAIFQFIPAILTFDQQQIGRALTAIKASVVICNQYRRNYTFVESISAIVKKPNYAAYTDVEAHAELCYAEALLLQAAMTVMEGEDLSGFIKGTIKVKSCYSSYKECVKILQKKERKYWKTEKSMIHFQSGVRLGMATFNLMISLLPQKIIELLEFVGFSSNKAVGLAELEIGSNSPGLRSILCDLTLLTYNLVISHFIGMPGDLAICDRILRKQLKEYPESVWFVMFKGRLEIMQGDFERAIETYLLVINNQNQWPQIRHICYWEIMWVNSLQMKWREASLHANKLINESSWSKTIYTYSQAALLLQLGDNRLTSSEKQRCGQLMSNAPKHKQRIAGKSLPMEKFVIKRCLRYTAQGGRLLLPGIELLCLWNLFPVLAKNTRKIQAILRTIERARERVEANTRNYWMGPYEADNRALLRYLHGSCLSAMNLPRLALETLETVSQYKNNIKEDTFIIPYTLVEMAMCHYQLGNKDQALQMLLDARKKYSKFSLESRLHFRLHAKIQLVKSGSSSNEDQASGSN